MAGYIDSRIEIYVSADLYSLTFDVNVYIRQSAVSLAREQKSRASLNLVMMTLTYSATTAIRLMPNKSSADLIFLL